MINPNFQVVESGQRYGGEFSKSDYKGGHGPLLGFGHFFNTGQTRPDVGIIIGVGVGIGIGIDPDTDSDTDTDGNQKQTDRQQPGSRQRLSQTIKKISRLQTRRVGIAHQIGKNVQTPGVGSAHPTAAGSVMDIKSLKAD
jgi:hypothetical protein